MTLNKSSGNSRDSILNSPTLISILTYGTLDTADNRRSFFQNIRSALQKQLSGKLSTLGAAYVRFLYALPIALIYLGGLRVYTGTPLPDINSQFMLYAVSGGICQIMFTVFLLWLFSFRNFAVGTTLSKLETVAVAIFGLLLLGDSLTSAVVIAIALSALGLIILTIGQSKISAANALAGLGQKSTLIGLVCATWLGLSVVLFRSASLSLQHDQFLMAAAFTLFIVLVIQTLIMGILLAMREIEDLKKVFIYWRPAFAVGISGGLASIGWFSAFTLQNASYVRALGQIELVFTFIVTLFWFRENVSRAEILGIALIVGSIILLLLGG